MVIANPTDDDGHRAGDWWPTRRLMDDTPMVDLLGLVTGQPARRLSFGPASSP
jgi:hypothetical protein